jgi:hypothetical protein
VGDKISETRKAPIHHDTVQAYQVGEKKDKKVGKALKNMAK